MKKTWKLSLMKAHPKAELLGMKDVLQALSKRVPPISVSFFLFVIESNCLTVR